MSMTVEDQERNILVQVLLGNITDTVPACPAYLGLYLAEIERANYINQYRQRLQSVSRYSIDHNEDTQIRISAHSQAYKIFQIEPDWIEVYQGASRAWAERTDIIIIDGILHYEDQVSGAREAMHLVPLPWGDVVSISQSESISDKWDISAQINDDQDIDRLVPIIPAEDLLSRGDYDLPKRLVGSNPDGNFLYTILDTPFSDAYDLLGFQGLMLMQHDNPERLHQLLQKKLEQTKEVIKAWAMIGIDGVYVEEVFSGADLISPKNYDEFVFTYNKPYFRFMSERGLFPIHYVCGDVIPRLERIIQYEIAAVAVEESKKSFRIDIKEVIDRVDGQVAVFGNIDAVRFGLHGSVEEMKKEVARQLEIGTRAKGFVVSNGSPFPLVTDPRIIDAMVRAAHNNH